MDWFLGVSLAWWCSCRLRRKAAPPGRETSCRWMVPRRGRGMAWGAMVRPVGAADRARVVPAEAAAEPVAMRRAALGPVGVLPSQR